MPLLKQNAFVADQWSHLADEDALPDSAAITVSLARLQKEWDTLAKHPGQFGVRLPNTVREAELAPFLPRLALVIVTFPAFNDGRSYSIARQLRLEGYQGEIRAAGNVLPDQLQFMRQVGIDSFDVSDRFPLDSWLKASRQMSLAYQRGLYRPVGEREVWSERHRGFDAWEEQPHAG
ncbi:MAG: DUF934 domain-containing protein [Proteobacteria bacterium]|nr:DUF934 domain-containing protein [Pseudomonadota bacterium]